MDENETPYDAFLRQKSQIDDGTGFTPLWMPDFLFDFQKDLVDWSLRKGRAALFEDCGLGKAQPITEPVLTPTGWRPIGDLRVGDEVIAGDGSTVGVLGRYPQGPREIVEVTFSDGGKARCDWEHLWTVQSENDASRGNPWRTFTTREILARGLRAAATRPTLQWRIPVVGAVELSGEELPIDPYVIGALLGDGSFRAQHTLSITTVDTEILNHVSAGLPSGVRAVRKTDSGHRAPTYNLTMPRTGGGNPLIAALRIMQLWGHFSHEKWIPDAYLRGSIAQRTALLQGLMDTDGFAAKDGTVQFSSSSRRLADDVIYLVRSLGGMARIASKIPTYTHRGERREGLGHWIVTIVLAPSVAPFRLTRKLARCRKTPRWLPTRKIVSIEPVGIEEAVCIAVDHPSHLYVTRDFVVTHNTPQQLVWAENVVRKTNRPVLILTPLAVAAQTVREAAKFDIGATRSNDGKAHAGINVTNYEKLHHFNPDDFAGVVCDESSAIKQFGGARQKIVTEFLRRMDYRLLCTATAAPNDYIELGTSAEALGQLGRMDMLSRFFKNDENSLHPIWWGARWRLKAHAKHLFWRWVCSWARAVRKPSDLGFDDARFVLPALTETQHVVENKSKFTGHLFAMEARTLDEQREERRLTMKERCEKVAMLCEAHPQSLVWCHLNPEGDLLEKVCPGAVQVSGADSDEVKEERLLAFADGQIRTLVTKPVIGAQGLNFQNCHHMTWFPSHSFQDYYQGVRRCLRFGQTHDVYSDMVTTPGEMGVLKNLQRKTVAADEMFSLIVREMNNEARITRSDRRTGVMEVPSWL